MFDFQSPSFLRRVLLVDALASAATGLLMALGAPLLAPLLGLPLALLREAGILLLPFAAFVAFIGTRPEVPRRGVWAVIVVNAMWVIDSIVLLFSGWVQPTLYGQLFIAAQAFVVAVLAELEFFAMRRSASKLAY
ncbi:hypothetical protein GCM10027343_12610 [Noviherbaspirillum agri]